MSKILFFMTAGATTIFVVTILAMVSMLVGDPKAPVNLWFNDHGAIVMTVEVLAIGILGMAAMIVDRWETLRELADQPRGEQSEILVDHKTNTPPNGLDSEG